MGQQESELTFYKNGTGVHSVSLKNEQLYLIREKYPDFSLSAYLQESLTEKEIKSWIAKHGKRKP